MEKYITESLELHLFFARIMKEHALFLEAGFTPKNANLAEYADNLKKEFEDILTRVVILSCGKVCSSVLNSSEIITPYTLETEEQTSRFTSIPIDFSITKKEELLITNNCNINNANLKNIVKTINKSALAAVTKLIEFKESLLKDIATCKLFTLNYPLLIEHILREAKLYRTYIQTLEEVGALDKESLKNTELFWNQIMMEHALFIRGLLDPTEEDLIDLSDEFAYKYRKLLKEAQTTNDQVILKNAIIEETIKYRDFKETGTKGIKSCKIKSVILPLLADHVLREANHYLRILKEY